MEDNSILFFKLWRNSFIRKKILTDCLFFNKHDMLGGKEIRKIDKLKNHKFKNYIISLNVCFNDMVPIDYYSPWIERLYFTTKSRKQPLGPIPSSVKELTLEHTKSIYSDEHHETPSTLHFLPDQLETLIFGDHFINVLISENSIPRNLKKLVIGEHFNQPLSLKGSIPSFLNHLEFKSIKPLPNVYLDNENLYKTLSFLKLPVGFNKPFQFNKCINLKTLGFQNYKILPGDLPPSLTELHIYNHKYNHPIIEGSLPINLNKLKIDFYRSTTSSIEMKFPINLKVLDLNLRYIQQTPENQELFKLPESITELYIDAYANFKIPKLPESILYLHFGDVFNQAIPELPENLLHLTIGSSFHQKLFIGDNISKLKHLELLKISSLYYGFNIPSSNYLPNSLKHLTLKTCTGTFVDELPRSLETLTLDKNIVYSNTILNDNIKVKILK